MKCRIVPVMVRNATSRPVWEMLSVGYVTYNMVMYRVGNVTSRCVRDRYGGVGYCDDMCRIVLVYYSETN